MAYVPKSVEWVNSRKWRSARKRDVWVLQCRGDHWTSPQSLTIVVLGMIQALIIASDVSVEHIISKYEETGLPHSCSTPTKTFAITCSLPKLNFHLLKQLSSISPNSPSFLHPPQSLPPHQRTPKNLYGKTQMKTDFPLAAKLWQVRDSLMGNMEFHLTLMGQRMAPHFEREHRQ